MNKYLKQFLHRGLLFGGFGPIILGIVYWVLDSTLDNFYISGVQLFVAILSIYALAFVQAGASVFNQIEEWSLLRSISCHFLTLYLAYVICYLLNTWIPLSLNAVFWFTLIFAVGYFIVWLTVFISIKAISKKMNEKLSLIK